MSQSEHLQVLSDPPHYQSRRSEAPSVPLSQSLEILQGFPEHCKVTSPESIHGHP